MEPAVIPERTEGRGLVLRCWERDDAAAMHDAVQRNLEHLRPWLAWIAHEPLSPDDRANLIETFEAQRTAGGDAVYAILQDGTVVGGCGLHRRAGPDTLEVGYWVDHRHLGQGIATRATVLLTDLAFTLPGIEHVEVLHAESNPRSAGVPRAAGFERVGVRSPDRDRGPAEQGDDVVWRVGRPDWLGRTYDG